MLEVIAKPDQEFGIALENVSLIFSVCAITIVPLWRNQKTVRDLYYFDPGIQRNTGFFNCISHFL